MNTSFGSYTARERSHRDGKLRPIWGQLDVEVVVPEEYIVDLRRHAGSGWRPRLA